MLNEYYTAPPAPPALPGFVDSDEYFHKCFDGTVRRTYVHPGGERDIAIYVPESLSQEGKNLVVRFLFLAIPSCTRLNLCIP